MIKNELIDIIVQRPTKKYWEKILDRQLNVGDHIKVNYNLLSPNSNVRLECICDSCSIIYNRKRSGNLHTCNGCFKMNRMKGNKFGIKNRTKIPSLEELKELLNRGYGKTQIANHYNVTLSVVVGWFNKSDLAIDAYKGRKYFKTTDDYQRALNLIKNNLDLDTISKISKVTNIPRHICIKLAKENDIILPSYFKNVLDDYNRILSNIDFYINENKTKTLTDIAVENNISLEQLKKVFKETNNIPVLHSYNKSRGELECKEFINSLGVECHAGMFEKKFEIDCYVKDRQFGLEYCGEYWHRFTGDNKNYHYDKFKFFADRGIALMTVFESEWKSHVKNKIIGSMIKQRLGIDILKLMARKCIVKEIDKPTADQFHNNNHMSGKCLSTFNYGLYYNEQLVSVLSIVKSRFDKQFQFEIARFSNLLNTVVVGGFSKLFKAFVKDKNPESCMTYADLRFGTGKVYLNSGFKLLGKTPPNYFYYSKENEIIESRMKYQKSKLKKFNNYSDEKTELQIMLEAGYYRIYDCGSNKYGWGY